MASSIRNEIKGTVKTVTKGILSEIIIKTAVGDIATVITTRSVNDLAIAAGDAVGAEIKAANVSVNKCDDNK